ncbi:hypothetical protein ON010_g16865 [Phytophthora cinnamomi]|nr:hypothetical protein ON010_g16865 [Phytophthora cinnamomi]
MSTWRTPGQMLGPASSVATRRWRDGCYPYDASSLELVEPSHGACSASTVVRARSDSRLLVSPGEFARAGRACRPRSRDDPPMRCISQRKPYQYRHITRVGNVLTGAKAIGSFEDAARKSSMALINSRPIKARRGACGGRLACSRIAANDETAGVTLSARSALWPAENLWTTVQRGQLTRAPAFAGLPGADDRTRLVHSAMLVLGALRHRCRLLPLFLGGKAGGDRRRAQASDAVRPSSQRRRSASHSASTRAQTPRPADQRGGRTSPRRAGGHILSLLVGNPRPGGWSAFVARDKRKRNGGASISERLLRPQASAAAGLARERE